MTDKDEPNSPSKPRPGNHPYYVAVNCDICVAPLVLADVFRGKTGKIWHDEWICPNHPDEGVIMDWPQSMIERLRGRSFEMDMEPEQQIPLVDLRDQGGLKVNIHPRAFDEMKALGIDPSELVKLINTGQGSAGEEDRL